ncbi:cation:proton antiporter [Lysobacter sp. HA35]
MFDIAIICLVVTALLAYLNARFVGLPSTIGVMAIALSMSVLFVLLDRLGFPSLHDLETRLVESIDFSRLLMDGLLSMLLFAGALHVDVSLLRRFRWQVGVLAVGGTVLSTLIVGVALWWLLPLFGFPLAPTWCFVFGALISPTDPIAVMGILRTANAPDDVGLVVAGESLFNDGVGVVLFAVLLEMATRGEAPTWSHSLGVLAHEAGGGLLLGAVVGYALFLLLRSINHYQVEVLLTLAAVLGGYRLATALHVSGPLALVVVGLLTGNRGRAQAMSDTTRHHVDLFWEQLDEMLNALLFVLIGLEIVLVPFDSATLATAAAVIALVLLARWLAVGLPMQAAPRLFRLPHGAWKVLTWGGLRGGISVALALSLPAGAARDLILALTYSVVVFSVLVQGLTIRRVIVRALSSPRSGLAPTVH